MTKNKVAPPFRVAEFDIMFGEGISREGDVLEVGLELGILDKRGSYYYYGEDHIAQGRENAKEELEDNPELMQAIEDDIRRKLKVESGEIEEEEEVAEESEAEEGAEEESAEEEA